MGQILKISVIIAFSLLIFLCIYGFWGWSKFHAPGPLKKEVTVIIERGGIDSISQKLHLAGVIENPIILSVAARLLNFDKTLKAGEYLFIPRISPKGTLNLLLSGKTVARRITLAEGLSTKKILDLLQRTEGLRGTVFPIPKEGALLPETYHFSYGDSRQGIVKRMAVAMHNLVVNLWRERVPNLPFISQDEAVVLASIIEKETAIPAERSRIAAVFINRINKGMRLQSDPTVVYGLTKGQRSLGRKLTRADLKSSSAYNTYFIRGLPPAPIANPGKASLHAVMHPADTNDLYFVANGQGGHLFAETLKEHNRNVARWRKLNRLKK